MKRFSDEAYRVLRPRGYFLFADHRSHDQVDALRTAFCQSGFIVQYEQEITANVLQALDLDSDRKQELIEQNVPRILRGFFSEFAAIKGTRGVYAKFASGEKQYLSFVLQR